MTLTEATRVVVSRLLGERRMTDSELARRSGSLTQSWVSRFLNADRGTLKIDQMEAIAAALDMTLLDLIELAEAERRAR